MSLLPSDDASWFAAEVQPHDAALRAWLLARFSSLGEIDDVVQETYTRVLQLRARDRLRVHAVKPLLFTTARNLALDELRRRRIVPMYMLPDTPPSAKK
jgi:RNA polymerase sigma-70 factor (ECF subfamily)